MWTDSHCHVHDEEAPAETVARAVAAGVDRMIFIGTGESSSARALDLAGELGGAGATLYATLGQHPHDASRGTTAIAALADELAASGRLGVIGGAVAIGECGLDYHYDLSAREAQRRAFAEQIAIARAHDLAVVVHTREAWDDTFGVLAEAGVPERLVIHCFTGGPGEARRCLELGAYLSFSGIVTFKNAGEVREAAVLCPADRLLTETDAPYLAPVPHRGRPNEPAFVTVVGEALAALRGASPEALAATSAENATRAFALPA
ncbi:MAG TPA: TatD family hydrolase [Acidimicrobiales bacterium]|nr:TatD family hydrolase [Acidimicrobiales bacterium]